MTKNKEQIQIVVYKENGTDIESSTEKAGVVYKKKDDKEWAHYGSQYYAVTRQPDGKAVAHIHEKFARKKRTPRNVPAPTQPEAVPVTA